MTDVPPMLDNGQLAAILGTVVTVAGGLWQTIRWAVKRITKAMDENTASNKEDANAKVKLAEEMAVLSDRINRVTDFVQEHTPVNQPMPRRVTPARGTEYAYGRPKTRGGSDE